MSKSKTVNPEDAKLMTMHEALEAKGFKHTQFEVSYQSMGPLGKFVVIIKKKAKAKVTEELRAWIAKQGFACSISTI